MCNGTVFRTSALERVRLCCSVLGFMGSARSRIQLSCLGRFYVASSSVRLVTPLPRGRGCVSFVFRVTSRKGGRRVLVTILPYVLDCDCVFHGLTTIPADERSEC